MNQHVMDYVENGWVVVEFPCLESLFDIKRELESELSRLVGKRMTLETYHEEATDDRWHSEIQVAMTQFYRERKFDVVSPLLPFFRDILGPDVSRQVNPFLRIARPNKLCDNIGFHRDTFYGGSPYEVSLFVPFVDLGPGNTMSVISGSHLHPESRYPTTRVENPDKEVVKGSKKHSLGFMYAPKVMDATVEELVQPLPLRVGQALI